VSPYVRTVKTSSGATAVQIVYSSRRGSREIEHLGSAHSDVQVEVLKAAARQRLAAGQGELELGLQPAGAGGGPLPIMSSLMGHLLEALEHAYRVLGFEEAAGGDEVFRQVVLARIIEPTSKLDAPRVPEEAGLARASYATIKRRLPVYAQGSWRQGLSAARAAHARLGRASLLLYDVTVRHEALVVRVGVRDHHHGPGRSQGREAGGSLTGETSWRAGAALTKPCCVSTAGWRERGERAAKAYARNRCHYLS
jgi:hypothetical protein